MVAVPLPNIPDGFCSTREAASRLKCSQGMIISLIGKKLLQGKQEAYPGAIGHHWLVSLESLAYFDRNYELVGEQRKTPVRRPESLIRQVDIENEEITLLKLYKTVLALHRRMDEQGWKRDAKGGGM